MNEEVLFCFILNKFEFGELNKKEKKGLVQYGMNYSSVLN